MRLILYTGKGGVGKSSIAAATAVRAAELGRRTLLVSSDPAHNLADIFAMAIGGEPVRVRRDLSVLEVDALKEIRENWQPAQDYFANFLAYLGMEDAIAEEVALIPGMEELFLLTRILREVESGDYDVVILSEPSPIGLTREGDGYRLTFSLPLVAKPDLDIGCKDQELVLKVGGHTRVFSLPDTLKGREIEDASFADGRLAIRFG